MKLVTRIWTDAAGVQRTAFRMDYRDPRTGQRKKQTLKGITSKKQAAALAASFWASLTDAALTGKNVPAAPGGGALTLGHLLAQDDERPGIAPRTRHGEKAQSRRLLAAFGEGREVAAITRAAVVEYQRRRTVEGCGPRGVNAEVGRLRAAVNRALDANWLGAPPCRWPPRLPESPKGKRALTLDELRRLIEACPPALADVVTVLGYTGIRPVELWRLTAADWHADNGTLTIRNLKRGAGANYTTRTVYCLPAVAEAVARRVAARAAAKKPAAPLFGTLPAERRTAGAAPKTARGTMGGDVHLGMHGFGKHLRAAATAAGITHPDTVTPYALRHTYATLFPGDLRDLQYSMGHADISTTARYRKAVESRTRAALELMVAAENGPTTGPRPDPETT